MSPRYDERRRDPPVQKAICVRCGWSGTPNHTVLRDDFGSASLIFSEKACPTCGAQTSQLGPPRSVPVQLIEAVREAKLEPDELLAIADAVREAPGGLSPRALSEQVPAASKLITVASRIGDKWVELLIAALTIVALYVQSMDAERAHRDAERAHRDAQQAHEDAARASRNAGNLSDDDVRRIVEKLETELTKKGK